MEHELSNKIACSRIMSARKALQAYLPKGVYEFNESSTFGSANIKMAVYGDEDEYVENMSRFSSFPGASEKFEFALAEPFNNSPKIYESLKNRNYIFKKDIFTHLQELAGLRKFSLFAENELTASLLGHYLKTKESQMSFEMVRYFPAHFKALDEKIQAIELPMYETLDFGSAFTILKTILPVNDKDPYFDSVFKCLKLFDGHLETTSFAEVLHFIELVIGEFDRFLAEYPKNTAPTVRIFAEGTQDKFMLVQELLNEMRKYRLDVSKIENAMKSLDELATVTLRTMRDEHSSEIDKVQFVVIPIRRTRHRAVYIPSFDGRYCISKVDFFMETMREAISVKSIFQMYTPKTKEVILEAFTNLKTTVFEPSRSSEFIDIELANEIRTDFIHKLMSKLNSRCIKDIRAVGDYGFTANNLKDEFRHLGLHKVFPEMMKLVEKVYEHIVDSKSKNVLTTSDMYIALEKLQVAGVLMKLPTVFETLHKYNACHWMVSGCEICEGRIVMKTEENPKPIKKAPKLSKTVEEPVPTTLESEENDSTVITTSKDEEKKTKKREKKRRQAEQKKLADEEPPKEDPTRKSESKVCEKCFRTSELCNSANEKLRLERIKTKALTKQVTEATQRELEKDEENRKLKEKLAALEAKLEEVQRPVETAEIPAPLTPEVIAPLPSDEMKPENKEALFELLNSKDLLPQAELKASQRVEELISKTTQTRYHEVARAELESFRKMFQEHHRGLEENIQWIRNHKDISINQLPALPPYPTLSKVFTEAYDDMVKGKELDDNECLICMDPMEDHSKTAKCQNCRRRYHMSCAWDWSIVKNECAVCREEIAFPDY